MAGDIKVVEQTGERQTYQVLFFGGVGGGRWGFKRYWHTFQNNKI